MHMSKGPSKGGTKALRFTFTYTASSLQLQKIDSVQMVVPPSAPISGDSAPGAFTCDLRDGGDATIFRRSMSDPIRTDVEVFSDNPKRSLSRQPVASPTGMFVVVVPDHADAKDVVLSRTPLPHAARGAAAGLAPAPAPQEIARFQVR
jgi:hypothetical protein